MHVFLFPGQGSQRRGMGKDLFDKIPEFTSVEAEIDQLLGYSVRKLCLEDEHKQLSQTQYTQPCLYIVNALHYYKALADGVPIATGGIAGACRHLVTGPGESYWGTLEVKRRRSRAPLTPIKRSNVGRAGLAV